MYSIEFYSIFIYQVLMKQETYNKNNNYIHIERYQRFQMFLNGIKI